MCVKYGTFTFISCLVIAKAAKFQIFDIDNADQGHWHLADIWITKLC